jgi:hypothetical protein
MIKIVYNSVTESNALRAKGRPVFVACQRVVMMATCLSACQKVQWVVCGILCTVLLYFLYYVRLFYCMVWCFPVSRNINKTRKVLKKNLTL